MSGWVGVRGCPFGKQRLEESFGSLFTSEVPDWLKLSDDVNDPAVDIIALYDLILQTDHNILYYYFFVNGIEVCS